MSDKLIGDIYTREKRRELMSRVKGKNTRPEIKVRSVLHRLGYRFRLHRAGLPGTPDIVLPRFRTVVFVHGCFWHQHPGCKKATIPKKNRQFWQKKLNRNLERDQETQSQLEALNWRVLTIWECELKDERALMDFFVRELPRS